MSNKTQNFLNLVRENPDLPIVPMVDYEIVCEDYGRWIGSLGNCYVGEYAIYDERVFDDREDFEERYYYDNGYELNEQFNYNPCINVFSVTNGEYTKECLVVNNENEKIMNNYLEKIADEYFKKAIIVNIDLPKE